MGNKKHTLSETKEYSTWCRIKGICYLKTNKEYKNNGARGIKMCDRWLDKDLGFLNFLSDMGEKPGEDYFFDRIDRDGNYEPSNCRWSHKSVRKGRPMRIKPKGRPMRMIKEGTKVSMLTVIREIERDHRNSRWFEVRCECGNITTISYSNLLGKTNDQTMSCGCYRRTHKLVDIPIGTRYGRLVVTKLLETDLTIPASKRRRMVEVQCDCGTVKEVRYHDLNNHKLVSCGCFKYDWFNSDDIERKIDYRRLYEKHYGVKILKGNQIHHIDGDRLNNDPSNLLEVTPEEHVWIHKRPELIGIERDRLMDLISQEFKNPGE